MFLLIAPFELLQLPFTQRNYIHMQLIPLEKVAQITFLQTMRK